MMQLSDEQKKKLQTLKHWFIDNIAEDPFDGTAFDSLILDALDGICDEKTEMPKVLDDTSNRSVVQMPGRSYPGVVVQGDTLFGLKLMAKSDEPFLKTQLIESLDNLYDHYMAVCNDTKDR